MEQEFATNLAGIALNILCAFIGGILIPLHYLLQRIREGKRLPRLRSWSTWVPFLLYPLPGAAICLVYQLGMIEISPIVALNLGLTGPAIVASRLVAEKDQSDVGG